MAQSQVKDDFGFEPIRPPATKDFGFEPISSTPKEEEPWYSKILTGPNAVRTIGSSLGDFVGTAFPPAYIPASFIGGAASEGVARYMEGQDFNPWIMGVEGLANLVPGPNIPGKGAGVKELAKYAGKSGLYGAGQGLIGATPRHIAETGKFELPSVEETATQTAGGGIVGTAFGGVLGPAHVGYQNAQPEPPKPHIDAATFAAMRDAAAAKAAPPPPPPPTEKPAVITVSHFPSAAENVDLANRGYVPIQGLKSADGRSQMVRKDLAPLYRNEATRPADHVNAPDQSGTTPATPATTSRPITPPDQPDAMGQDYMPAGDIVPVPIAEANSAGYIENMAEGGYKLTRTDGVNAIFERIKNFGKDDKGTFTPQEMWENLKALFRRDPTPEEVDDAMRRQVRPGEETGRVAEFPTPIAHPINTEINDLMTQLKGVTDYQGRKEIMDRIQTLQKQRRPLTYGQPPPGFVMGKGKDPFGPQPEIPPQDRWDAQIGTRPEDAQQSPYGDDYGIPGDTDPNAPITSFPNSEISLNDSRHPLNLPETDIAGIRQQNVLGPRAAGPEDMPVMPEMGQQEIPWSRGEADMPIDADARARELASVGERFRTPMENMPQQQTMEPAMKDAEIADYLGREDLQTPEMTDVNMPPEEPAFARVQGGGLTASANLRGAVENITRDYTKPLPGVIVREGMQNSLDAADLLGDKGTIRVRLDDRKSVIEIHDNGSGLDEDTLAYKLIEIFSSGKEGEEGATGGKGIGSASYIYGGKYFKIETVAIDKVDGKKYKIIAGGTPEQFLDPIKGSDWEKVPVDKSTPTGTTIEVHLKDNHDITDARSMMHNIIENTRNRHSRVIFDEQGYSANEHISKIEPSPYSKIITEHKFKSSKDDKLIGDFVTTYRNSEVKVLVPEFDKGEVRDYYKVHYLNNGMYQFTEEINIGQLAEGVPERVLVDIHPLVDDLDELYPFINTREDVKKDIRDEVSDFIKKNITGPGIDKRKNRVQELYDSMTPVPIQGTKRKSIIFDPGNRLTKQEMNDLVNNPVTQEIVRLYDSLIDGILTSTGRPNWITRLEGVGLVLDPGMHGVHIPNPKTAKSTILINPFIRIGMADVTPAESAWKTVLTSLHEVAHVGKESATPIKFSDIDTKDPRLGEFFSAYLDQIVEHGDIGWAMTGHGMDFAHRLGEVYAKYGVQRTYAAADAVKSIFTRGSKSGGYSPELQKLLRIYKESRGRSAVTEDLLSGTGVKQANREPTREGNVPGTNTANGDGIAAKVTALFKKFIGDDQGAVAISDIAGMGKKLKEATGWGQGNNAVAAEHNFIKEALAVPTNATTMLDLSAPGRQGLSQILTPEFWSAAGSMFKGLHYDSFKQMDAALRNTDLMKPRINRKTGAPAKSFGEEIGIKMYSPASEMGKRAENTASRWLESIPVAGMPIRMSNRAYITFLNHLNVNRAEKLLNRARNMSIRGLQTGETAMPGILGGIQFQSGKNLGFTQKVTPQEALDMNPYHNLPLAKEIADFVNTATGHGPLKTHLLPHKQAEVSLEAATEKLGYVLFSPGLLASRVRMMNPSTYLMATPYVRKQYTKAALSTVSAWFIASQMIKMAAGDEADVNIDNPTSADFGKVRIGDARLDLGGGFLQFATAVARLWTGGSTSSASGEFHKFGEGYQAQTQEDMMERFFVNKLNPVAKFAWDVASASQYNPFHVEDRAIQLFVPLFYQDLHEIYKENPELLPMFGTAAAFGGGTQIYSKGESVSKFVDPENDWNVEGGGGIRSLMPWNMGEQ